MMYIKNEVFKALGKTDKSIKPQLQKAIIGSATVVSDRAVKFIFSTASMDRDYDIISQEGIDVLNYTVNPVVFFSHDHDSAPIGKTTSLSLENGNLTGVIEFAPFENPEVGKKAEGIYQLCRDGFLNAVSIGFIAKEWNFAEQEDRYARDGADITKCELVEVSIVGIPSNRGALIQEIGTGSVTEPVAVDVVEVANPIDLLQPELPPVSARHYHAARLRRILEAMD